MYGNCSLAIGSDGFNLLEGAAAGFGDAGGDEDDTKDADDAEDGEHCLLAHRRNHDGEEEPHGEGSNPVEGGG